MTALGEPNLTAIVFFIGFIALSLGITVWAARKTRTTDQFYAAGRSVTAFQNGVLIQDAQELLGPTTNKVRTPYSAHADKLPLSLQDHGHPVRFRNVWIRELAE